MKNSIRFFIGISLLVLVVCFGCGGQNSEAEMKQAQEAMEKAKSIFAEDLAPSDWNEAIIAWEQAQAAVKEGKPAKTYFLRAKSRFEKTAKIAEAAAADISREVTAMQLSIGERFGKVRSGIDSGRVPARIQKQIKPVVEEVEEGMASVESLVGQGSFLKARALAKELQAKIYDAELIIAGKKPVSRRSS